MTKKVSNSARQKEKITHARHRRKQELRVRSAPHGRSRLGPDLGTGLGACILIINLGTQNAAFGLHEFRNWK